MVKIKLKELEIYKNNEKGITYNSENYKLFLREKESISGNNKINSKEEIIFLSGKAKLTIKEESIELNSICKFIIPKNTFHKIEALTKIQFLLKEN